MASQLAILPTDSYRPSSFYMVVPASCMEISNPGMMGYDGLTVEIIKIYCYTVREWHVATPMVTPMVSWDSVN